MMCLTTVKRHEMFGCKNDDTENCVFVLNPQLKPTWKPALVRSVNIWERVCYTIENITNRDSYDPV